MQPEPAVTRRLAEFLAASRWQDVPAEARREAARTVVNFVGTALGGCRDEAVELALRRLPRSLARRGRR